MENTTIISSEKFIASAFGMTTIVPFGRRFPIILSLRLVKTAPRVTLILEGMISAVTPSGCGGLKA